MNLPNQPNVVEVHRPCAAAGCRGVLGPDANRDRIDIGKVYAERSQVDDPVPPSGKLRRSRIIAVDYGCAIESHIYSIGSVRRFAPVPQ